MRANYIEATGEETEARLLKGLRRQLADLPGNLSLSDSLAALRRGRFLEAGQKVLLRMGSKNATAVKAKLREIRAAIAGKTRTPQG